MASYFPQDRDAFFRSLDALDTLSDDDDTFHTYATASRDSCRVSRQSPRSDDGDGNGVGRPFHPRLGTRIAETELERKSDAIETHKSKEMDLLSPERPASIAVPPAIAPTASSKLTRKSTAKRRVQTQEDEAPVSKKSRKAGQEAIQIFEGQNFFFVPNNKRAEPRKRRIEKAVLHGAVWAQSWTPSVTYIIVEDGYSMSSVKKYLRHDIPEGLPVVSDRWLSACLGFKELRDTTPRQFQVPGAKMIQPKIISTERSDLSGDLIEYQPAQKIGRAIMQNPQGSFRDALDEVCEEVRAKKHLLDKSDGDESPQSSDADTNTSFDDKMTQVNQGFQCMKRNDGTINENPNNSTIELLEELASFYGRMNDNWRPRAYRRAIMVLRRQDTRIETKEQALALPRIGARLADKIVEIATTNRLRRLENVMADPRDKSMQLFMGIYGVGLSVASSWIAQGLRTLKDVEQQADLTPSQRIGLERYHDFQTKIPRTEVAEHARIVEQALHLIDPKLQLIVAGSYRRGKQESGDIDCLITKPDASIEHIRILIMESVVPHLEGTGFLKASLAASRSREDGSKWHGVSAIPGSQTWRRIDLLFVPWNELGAATLYFTGNDIFNRSIRLLASKYGMRLNQHGLFKNVMRGPGRQKLTDGTLVESQDEQRIFEALGVRWRPAEHRNCG